MRCRINCQDLVDEENLMKAEWPPDFPRPRFRPYQSAPRPEWHGRECIRIAPNAFRFPEEKSPKYHLIAEWRLTEIESTDDATESA